MHQQGKRGLSPKTFLKIYVYISTHTQKKGKQRIKEKEMSNKKMSLKATQKAMYLLNPKSKLLSRNLRIILALNIRFAAKSLGST